MKEKFFTQALLQWADEGNLRRLPWKETKDPYLIWLSEIILQQTRVEQGTPYFLHFRKTWPTLQHLAKAKEDQVLKAWQGLGYYSRARRLLACAKRVQDEYGGRFPSEYEELLKLPGIGPYTAAAIASFAFDQAVPAIDGNAHRLLARVFGIDLPPHSTEGKRAFRQMGARLISKERPADFNQAVMDFASTVCKPKPLCENCPFSQACTALLENRIAELPRKTPPKEKKKRFFYYLFIHLPKEYLEHLPKEYLEHLPKGAALSCQAEPVEALPFDQYHPIRQRPEGDIWQGLWEFPLIELPRPLKAARQITRTRAWKELGLPGVAARICHVHPPLKHLLTHRELHIQVLEVEAQALPEPLKTTCLITDTKNLPTFAWPKPLEKYANRK